MSGESGFFAGTLAELNRRKVLRTLGFYTVGAFIALQVLDAVGDALLLPRWAPTAIVSVILLGFPVVFLLAWLFEVTPQGIKRTHSAGRLPTAYAVAMFILVAVGTLVIGVGLFRYFSAELAMLETPAPAFADFNPPENSLAVLPFADLSADQDQAYLSDGIAEEILNLLAQVKGLQVAARTSSFAFRGQNTDIRDIGRQLNVGTVLEGSVRKAGDKIRLTAQLIDARNGFHLWSQNYDRALDDVFALQDEVASAIADQLIENFDGVMAATAMSSQPSSFDAFQAYQTGRLAWWRRTPAALEEAIRWFARAVEIDPAYAPAYAGLADAWLLSSSYGNVSQETAVDRATEFIEKALRLDPSSAEAFAALGLARWQIGQFSAAESALRRAAELDPSYSPALLWLAGVLGDQSRLTEERKVLDAGLAVDPLNRLLRLNSANNHLRLGQRELGFEELHAALEAEPDSSQLLLGLADWSYEYGNLSGGYEYAERAVRLSPTDAVTLSGYARHLGILGFHEAAREVMDYARAQAPNNLGLWQVEVMLSAQQDDAVLLDQALNRLGQLEVAQIQQFIQLVRGIVAANDGDWQAADTAFRAGLQHTSEQVGDTNFGDLLAFAAAVARQLGEDDRAETLIRQARGIAARLEARGSANSDFYYFRAALAAADGDTSAALNSLQMAYDTGWRDLWVLDLDIRFDGLREQPAFQRIRRQLQQDFTQARAVIGEDDLWLP